MSSLWMVVVMALLPGVWTAAFFALLFVLNLAVEYGYYRGWPVIAPLYGACFGRMMRNPDKTRFHISGAPPVLLAAAITSLLFPGPFAASAFATMLLGDTAAALIGRRFGRIRFANGKSLEGSLAFIAVGMAIVLASFCIWRLGAAALWLGFAGVWLASAAEFFNTKLHIDDNFSIPLIVGGVMCISFLL